ncbi:hypothetical protein P3T76_015590 [Phytophthora citrophthora]|uniref:Uncharacterized protein n=1 Tax=Phytophthora citrophthora TaxID=4793 RepID=A0AAD9FZ73_9STRA|nr:hypothetical protein P3T76_015590 [Phytophthora citrophthora]
MQWLTSGRRSSLNGADPARPRDVLQQTLLTLISLVDNREPPTLQAVMRLVNVCLQALEQKSNQDLTFLRSGDVANRIMKVLAQRLNDTSSSVRKIVSWPSTSPRRRTTPSCPNTFQRNWMKHDGDWWKSSSTKPKWNDTRR